MNLATLQKANAISEQLGRLNADESRVKSCGKDGSGQYDLLDHMSGCYGARREFEKFRAFLLAKITKRRKELEEQLSKL